MTDCKYKQLGLSGVVILFLLSISGMAQVPDAPVLVKEPPYDYLREFIWISWDAVPGVDGYEVFAATNVFLADVQAGSMYKDRDAPYGEWRCYKARSYIQDGDNRIYSSFSDVVCSWRAPAPIYVPPPTNVMASSGLYRDRVEITWNDPDEYVDYYTIKRRTDGGDWESVISQVDTNVMPGVVYEYAVNAWNLDGDYPDAASTTVVVHGYAAIAPNPRLDFDDDGMDDIAVYCASSGVWAVRCSSDGELLATSWGWPEAQPVPADYDGDHITDMAVYFPEAGTWYIRQSSLEGQLRTVQWGWREAKPVVADYDGDGKADITVFCPVSRQWYIRYSSTQQGKAVYWGYPGDAISY